MARWRTLASLVAALVFTGAAGAQTYSLAEPPLPGTHFRVQLSLSLNGQLKLQQDGKEVALKETCTAMHDFLERILDAGAEGTAARSARVYKEAKVAITVADDKLERTLRPERTFLVAARGRDGVVAYSIKGPLTREEVDVTDHFDTLAVTGLLPAKEVAVGDTWKPGNAAAQALCHLQALSDHTLTCKLDAVKDDVAVISVHGTAAGIDYGASANIAVRAVARFDLKAKRLVALEWQQTDDREAGPVSPASHVEVTTKLIRTPIEPASELHDVVIAQVPDGPPGERADLDLKDTKGRYELRHGRDWVLVGRTDEHTVLRLMDRGDFVAQASIAPWKKAEPGKHLSADEVKAIVANSPGWAQDTLIKAEEVKLPTGQWAYLVAGEGDLDGVRAVQYFYLIAGPEGDQAMLTFTMTPAQTQKLGSRDLELVRGFLLPGARREGEQAKVEAGN
jgi:hypothetical protein